MISIAVTLNGRRASNARAKIQISAQVPPKVQAPRVKQGWFNKWVTAGASDFFLRAPGPL